MMRTYDDEISDVGPWPSVGTPEQERAADGRRSRLARYFSEKLRAEEEADLYREEMEAEEEAAYEQWKNSWEDEV